ncbi:MAG: HEAT repeat domain-containing protein [Nanoarchaeota archaeon]
MDKDWKKVVLDQEATKEERIQAAFRIEDAKDDESIHALGRALETDLSPIVRHECAFSLGETAHPAIAAQYLMKAVETDPSIFVRHEAILALGTLGKKEYISFIKKHLKDPELEMQESAEIAIQRIESK